VGPVEKAVRSDVRELGDLTGFEPLLAALAVRLAVEVDAFTADGDRRTFVQLTRELRQTVAHLVKGRTAENDDDPFGDLASPE